MRVPMNSNTPPFMNEELNDIWQKSKKAEQQLPIDESEVEAALAKVHKRLPNRHSEKQGFILSEKAWLNTRYLVAAMALIVLSLYFIFVPKTISVPYGEIAIIDLPDGSTAELNSGTSINYTRLFGWTHRNMTVNGEVFFSVNKSDTPFIVEANGTITEVIGTQFNIRSWKSDPLAETKVSVSEGAVTFYPGKSSDNRIELSAGTQSHWNLEMQTPADPVRISQNDIAGWRTNRLVFQNQPLAIILDELERRFNTEIVLQIPGAEKELLTAYYSDPGSITSVLDDISTVKGFRYAPTSNGYRIYK